MPRYILTVTLNPSIDRTLINGKKEIVYAGGKGINVARVLSKLGQPTVAAGIIGGYSLGNFKKFISQEDFRQKFLETGTEVRTNLNILSQDGSRVRVLEAGNSVDNESLDKFIAHFSRLLIHASVVVLSGRNAHGASASLYSKLISIANNGGIPVVLDSSGEALKAGIKAKPWMIKPNLEEAQELSGIKLNNLEKISKFCLTLNKKGIEIVVVSLWLKGAVVSSRNQVWHARPPDIKAVNDVGCGDALVAGFIDSHLRGCKLEDCLRRSVGVGILQALSYDPRKIDLRKICGIINGICLRKI